MKTIQRRDSSGRPLEASTQSGSTYSCTKGLKYCTMFIYINSPIVTEQYFLQQNRQTFLIFRLCLKHRGAPFKIVRLYTIDRNAMDQTLFYRYKGRPPVPSRSTHTPQFKTYSNKRTRSQSFFTPWTIDFKWESRKSWKVK